MKPNKPAPQDRYYICAMDSIDSDGDFIEDLMTIEVASSFEAVIEHICATHNIGRHRIKIQPAKMEPRKYNVIAGTKRFVVRRFK